MKQLVIVVAIVLCARPAFADPKVDAKVHMDAAAVAFKEGRFDDTLIELNKAYALDPQPELHYSIGQVYMKLGRCSDAILAYENFLASKPSADRVDLANQAIAKCKAQTPLQPPPSDPTNPVNTGTAANTNSDQQPPPGVEPQPPAPTTKPIPESRTDSGPPAWYKDKLAIGLTGGGAIITIAGLVLLSSARTAADDAATADTYGDSSSQYDDAKSRRTTALLVTTVGLAAIGVGVWRFMKVRKAQEQTSGVALVPTTSGGLVTYSGGF